MSGEEIGAVVLAAGQSRRMGRPKLVLPWGDRTIIETVVGTLHQGGVADIVVVTGGAHAEVCSALANSNGRVIYNQDYATGEMLSSAKIGLDALSDKVAAALIVLGDQPQMEAGVVSGVIDAFRKGHSRLVVPSHQMKRGHPWLIGRGLWKEVLRLPESATLRDFLNALSTEIDYVTVDTPSILADLDTPGDYQVYKPG
ncbi:MAG TPA: nucleotidyltransferase family protein [Anaerolineaceae bacterium]|nr:nucleotidyltransferase family protein [Anaerolineaceae bacterium]